MRPSSPPSLAPILQRLEGQLSAALGSGRLTREDVLVPAFLAVERKATGPWTSHKTDCWIHEKAGGLERCTCGPGDRKFKGPAPG